MNITIDRTGGPEFRVKLIQEQDEVIVYVNEWSVVRFQERSAKLQIQLDRSIEDKAIATDAAGHIFAVKQ